MYKYSAEVTNYSLPVINRKILIDPAEFIARNEQEYIENIDEIAADVVDKGKKIILLSGPSSSGKTTTSYLLIDALKLHGRNAVSISLDNFFIDNDKRENDENGNLDYESIKCLDLPLIHSTFKSLSQKKTTILPIFDFPTGKRSKQTQILTLGDSDVVIFEGIHALNNLIWEGMQGDSIAKIYISAHSTFYVGTEKILKRRNVRLLRRIVRDNSFRSCSAEKTILMWDSVCRGEEKYIWPFSEIADYHLNTTFPYDIGCLKDSATSLLSVISPDSLAFKRADFLLGQLTMFVSCPTNLLPKKALLREFVGESHYKY